MSNTVLGKRIAELRKRRGLTQTQLAQRIEMSHSSVASWETGTRDPDSAMIAKLAHLFDVPTDFLLGRTDNPRTYSRKEEAATKPTKNQLGNGDWQSIDEVASETPDIANEMKKLGATLIQLNAELLDRGMSREELENLLRMMIKLQKKEEPPKPTE